MSHLPWFFGEFVCLFCELCFLDSSKLKIHAKTQKHLTQVEQYRVKDRSCITKLRQGIYKQKKGQLGRRHPITQAVKDSLLAEFTCTTDLPSGYLEKNLFPTGPVHKVAVHSAMETPVRDEAHDNGIVPVSPGGFELFQELVTAGTSAGEQPGTSRDSPRDTSPTSSGSSTLPRLPSPPRGLGGEPRSKRPCLEHDDIQVLMKRLDSLEKSIEAKVDAVSHKVVDTAKHQTKDLERSFKAMGDRISESTSTVMAYQNTLATQLQTNICGAVSQLQAMRQHGGLTLPLVKALESLAAEAGSLYRTEHPDL